MIKLDEHIQKQHRIPASMTVRPCSSPSHLEAETKPQWLCSDMLMSSLSRKTSLLLLASQLWQRSHIMNAISHSVNIILSNPSLLSTASGLVRKGVSASEEARAGKFLQSYNTCVSPRFVSQQSKVLVNTWILAMSSIPPETKRPTRYGVSLNLCELKGLKNVCYGFGSNCL